MDDLNHRLGHCHGQTPSLRYFGRPSSLLAHQLLGDEDCVSSTKTFPPRSHHVLVRMKHFGGRLHKSPGPAEFAPSIQAGATDLALG